jgi:uncharacterized membrane protein
LPEARSVVGSYPAGAFAIGVSESVQEQPRDFGPTFAPGEGSLNTTLARNIRAMEERRRAQAAHAPLQARLAEAITRFTGSMAFVYLHLALFGFWIVANLGWVPGVPAWDESFVILAMIASVEAIFLSTFVLISQNRMQAAADRRADLDLQINLLSEHEVTKLVAMVSEISTHLGLHHVNGADVEELKRNVAPEAVLDAIESRED